ncbi:MAG: ABC transporter permease [Oscillospiraceae bacterium]|nr:ABC transporter permease [Oscillospiraceae bacterium]
MKNKITDFLKRSQILVSAASLILALLICGLVIAVCGYSPMEAYGAMLKGAFGSKYYFSQTLGTMIPLVFSGLAMLMAVKVGIFNIGIEGQMLVGSFAAALAGRYITGLPKIIHLPLALLAGAMMGGLWALIAAWLKNALGINEVILTIMLNYVAQYVVSYLVSFPFHAEGNVVRTEDIQPTASMTTMVAHTRLYTGIYLAVAATVLIWLMLRYTKFGYELRAVGSNSSAAETAGINAKRYILAAMFLSGALAGIGGAGEVLGYWGYYIPTMTQGYGFDGIAIATMGRSEPLGTFISAFLFGALRNGATGMNRSTSIPGELIEVLEGLVILFVSTPGIFRAARKIIRARNERRTGNGLSA